ncbi:MAG: thiamine phosphate synthase [Campylobacterota bacterium]|nr:thiamine phosphate synthase [Campylobacterota bacterium]
MRLYALCDEETLVRKNSSLETFVNLCRSKNAEIIQYRSKNGDTASIKSSLIQLRKLWDGFLIVNDRYELTPYCDGVHIGQEDLLAIDADPAKAVETVRSVIGTDKIIGISTHNAEEISKTNELDINYIGLGAYRPTTTKDVSTVLENKLDALAAKSEHPVAAIGGVRFDDTFEHVTYHVIGSALYEN